MRKVTGLKRLLVDIAESNNIFDGNSLLTCSSKQFGRAIGISE